MAITAYCPTSISANLKVLINGSITITYVTTSENNGSTYQALRNAATFVVPSGDSYIATFTGVALTIGTWTELR